MLPKTTPGERRALFLDRDGVINIDHGYVYRADQFQFVDGIFSLCRKAMELNYLIFVITNQSGIGRGYYTDQQFHDLTGWMCQQFVSQGIRIESVYYCPYHEKHGKGHYRQESTHRKPGPGMFLDAAADFDLDLQRSVLVGDKETDIQAGITAGIGCNLLYSDSSPLKEFKAVPTAVVSDLVRIEGLL